MANPFVVQVGTFVGGAGSAQSGNVTFSFYNTAGFDAFVPIQITNAATNTLSAGAEVVVYRSSDNGTTWETEGNTGTTFSRPSAASQVQRRSVTLSTGQYLVAVQVGGGQTTTWTVQMLTAQLITAYA